MRACVRGCPNWGCRIPLMFGGRGRGRGEFEFKPAARAAWRGASETRLNRTRRGEKRWRLALVSHRGSLVGRFTLAWLGFGGAGFPRMSTAGDASLGAALSRSPRGGRARKFLWGKRRHVPFDLSYENPGRLTC